MASYPEPPPGEVEISPEQPQPPAPATSAPLQTTPPSHHQQLQPNATSASTSISTPTPTPTYDGLPSPVPATTVASHGLQVLQAASAAPITPTDELTQHYTPSTTQQYAQSATLHMGDAQFAPLAHSTPAPPLAGSQSPTAQKVTRLRRACDLCSQRKVKCDESGPPCKPCADLQVDCTFNREMKRRGPPNKHAEAAKAAKRPRSEPDPPQNAAEALVSIAANNAPVTLDAETIAPWPILKHLVDDFFTYIHPLVPFPHEPSFRSSFDNRIDRSSGEFLALLASMISALVSSFPRSARSHLKAQQSTELFPTAATMIEHCRTIALDARGTRFMLKQEMSVDDAATSYFLGLSAAYTLQWKPFKRFMAETLSFCREVVAPRQRDISNIDSQVSGLVADGNNMAGKPIDHIKDQIGKRIFWVMVSGVRSMTQLGVSMHELPFPPTTTPDPYPEPPLEVDDEFIFMDHIRPQPEGTISLITGFNKNAQTYMTMNELTGVDMCYGMNFFDWGAQKNILSNALANVKRHADDLPPELQIKVGPNESEMTGFDDSGLQYYPPAFSNALQANDMRRAFAEQPVRRRQLQLEIQKSNIYVSQLATRSYFVERYLSLRDVHRSQSNFAENADDEVKDERDALLIDERELIVQNLLTVLASISQRNMEPNGQSIINKIRQVASTLLTDTPERKGPVTAKAEEYLNRFLDILMKLEKSGVGRGTDTMTSQDEEEELQHWVNLRDYQAQFLSNGGFLGSG
ncbi:hypothetical protein F5X99DRAFT_394909 [Biscogniauxia marginata]|nr:hypothetical protein F5X99DRAFT_394909 [Biscogniauxia marginata]